MELLKITADDFNLKSTWTCTIAQRGVSWENTYTEPTTAKTTVAFAFALPANSAVKSAKMYATLGSPFTGANTSKINGVAVGVGGEKSVDVAIADGASSVSVECLFKAKGDGENDTHPLEAATYNHTSSLSYEDVYLLIEYEITYTPPELIDYTDPDPIAGATYVKAVHMTELHENVNRLRTAKGLAAYAFTPIAAMQTMLAGWNEHVLEIRAALDEVSADHEAWLVLGANCPRLDVLLQLRSMVEVLAA